MTQQRQANYDLLRGNHYGTDNLVLPVEDDLTKKHTEGSGAASQISFNVAVRLPT